MRQDDGGWAIPLRTVGMDWREAWQRPAPVQPDRSKPFSHMVTGMVLRAFAAHPVRRASPEAQEAGALLASRFFKPDRYADRRDKGFWEKVSYPFWFTDVVSALDSLSFLGFTADDLPIRAALDWLQARQQPDGLFDLKLLRSKDKDLPFWVCLAVSRLFRRYFAGTGIEVE
jgi:hypothetical protein